MLQLKNITKNYLSGENAVRALKGISITFRKNEFVSILGHSGCGKTTLLNIIGGLDRYTDGDLYINGRSTKSFRDRDWDTYRNHSIGFVFQSYNLIPHQTVLANVEMSLTLGGVSKAERRARAAAALEKVGLGDQLKKKPTQMSGGQMQRVAIARALVNDPEIVLADEPTGALDSETSVQVMEILKEVARDRLVIMVTHNPELAQAYSTRIVRLSDGEMVADSDPYTEEETPDAEEVKAERRKKDREKGKPSMSFRTALGLSLRNLMTKRGRTFLTSFAGSIGIIGIALILSLSSGINAYIKVVQEDTLSSYPITLEKITQDYSAMLGAVAEAREKAERTPEAGVIYVDDSAGAMMSAMSSTKVNDLGAFRAYLEAHREELGESVSDIRYTYEYTKQIFSSDGKTQISPTTIFEHMGDYFAYLSSMMSSAGGMVSLEDMFNIFTCMMDNPELLQAQYDVVDGKWAEGDREVMLVLDENNSISKLATYILGLNDQNEMEGMFNAVMRGEDYEVSDQTFRNEDFLGMKFYVVPNSAYYEKTGQTYTVNGKTYAVWKDIRQTPGYDGASFAIEHGVEVTVVGILRPNDDALAHAIQGVIAYNQGLDAEMMAIDSQSEIAVQQNETPEYDVFSGLKFEQPTITTAMMEEILSHKNAEEKQNLIMMLNMMLSQSGMGIEVNEGNLAMLMAQMANVEEARGVLESLLGASLSTEATLEDNLKVMGHTDESLPKKILIYAVDFEGKDKVTNLLSAYNDSVPEDKKIQYTDVVGLLMSSITLIIDVISYVLIAFVSISLVVSSIMIGIITYISVLERTKEIGVLRALGASKRDISRVFNAETFLVGALSGLIGIGATVILCFPINAIIRGLSGIGNIGAYLPWQGGLALVCVSMLLTVLAGFIPARLASKKDPVEALRTE